MAHLLTSALSIAYLLQGGPAVAPVRANMVVMQQNQPTPAPTAPKSGWSLTMAGGERTVEDVRKAQEKAKKSYNGKDDVTTGPCPNKFGN